ncbi:MAG: hypothetical protein KTR33_17060 [Gammaproteobacteria bacterium]|nr:hypothetical protein [Gammaproteobacteria bacterium]
MEKIWFYLRGLAGAALALLLFVVTLPLTLFLAAMTMVVGTIMALRFRQRLNEAVAASRNTHPQSAPDGVVIDQVKVNGVWQAR